MFQELKENRKAVDSVVALLRRKSPEDVVSHEEIAEASGLEPGTNRYNRLVLRAREIRMKEGGPWSHSLVGEGYRMLTQQEQLTVEPAARIKKARSQFRKLATAAMSIPETGLAPGLRRIRDAHLEAHEERERRLKEQQEAADRAAEPYKSHLVHPNIEADSRRIRLAEEDEGDAGAAILA